MKYIVLLLSLVLLIGCSVSHEEPAVSEVPTAEVRSQESVFSIEGAFISEDYRDKIEFFGNGSFYYQEDCNDQARFGDWQTWRIGRWTYEPERLNLGYHDGGKATATLMNDTLIYEEYGNEVAFLPSAEVHVTVTKEPSWSGSFNESTED